MIAVETTPSLNPGATMARVRKDKKTRGSKGKRWSMQDALDALGPRPDADIAQHLRPPKAKPSAVTVDEAAREILAALGLPPVLDREKRALVRDWLGRGWSLRDDILPAIRLELGSGRRRRGAPSLASFTPRIRHRVKAQIAAERKAIAALDERRADWDRRHAAILDKGHKQRAAAGEALRKRMPDEYRQHALRQEVAGGDTVAHTVRGDVRWDSTKREVERQVIGVTRRRRLDAETALDWTPDQTKAAEEIRAAWATITSDVAVRGMSYADERVDSSYRQPVAPPDASLSDETTHYTTWKQMCPLVVPPIDVEAVIEVVAEGYFVRTVDAARNRRHGWASEQVRRGLDLWRPARRLMRRWIDAPRRGRSLQHWLRTALMIDGLPARGSILVVHGQARRQAVRRAMLDLRGEALTRATRVIIVPDFDSAGFLVGCVMPVIVDCAYEEAAPAPLFRMVSRLAIDSNQAADVIRHAAGGRRHG